MVDDHSRLAYSGILPDVKAASCAGFIRPHCPWRNGKVERFNRTLQTEWAYRQIFTSNTEGCVALAPWLNNNTRRRHTALGGQPHQPTVTNLMTEYTSAPAQRAWGFTARRPPSSPPMPFAGAVAHRTRHNLTRAFLDLVHGVGR